MQIISHSKLTSEQHGINTSSISEAALHVLNGLHEAGYRACLVGGSVRDLMLGREPKDFDVATDAHPEQIRDLFRSARIIGRRFRLVHVRYGREVIEVATFRAPHDSDNGKVDLSGRILRDNEFGDIETDAMRRDFTVNALYYDISDRSVLDYADGVSDLRSGQLRLIGDPETRFREDPVRMLRAVRFASKLGFLVDKDVEDAIFRLGHLLTDISPARLFDETLKLFHGGCALQTFESLRHFDLFRHLFPMTDEVLSHEEDHFPDLFVARALANTDDRINSGKPVTPAFLFAVMLWEPIRIRMQGYIERGLNDTEALQKSIARIASQQAQSITIPKRFGMPMRDIWFLQPRFKFTRGKRPGRLYTHPRFRAGYDFLCLRGQSGEDVGDLCEWWTEYQEKHGAPDPVKTDKRPPRRRNRPRQRSRKND